MSSHRTPWPRLAAVVSALVAAAATAPAQAQSSPAPAASAPANAVRAEVAKPLIAAQEAIKLGTPAGGKKALARVAEAEAMAGLTPFETYQAQRIKAVAAFNAGDLPLSVASFERALASPFLPAGDRLPITEAAAKIAVQGNMKDASDRLLRSYKALGGTDAGLRLRLALALNDQGDHAGALKEAQALAQADEAAGKPPAELLLKVMAISQNKLGDASGYTATLEKLALHYGKLDYWADLISRTARRPGFSDERLGLDVYRLQRAVGLTLEGDELADMAQRAQLAGLPAEAQKLMDEGYVAGLLGKGTSAAAHQKLRDQATKAAAADQKQLADSEAAARNAKDGNAAATLGLALAGTGANERALALMELGQTKGGLRRPDDALLHLGMVQVRLGRQDDALKSFAAVQGADGAADLARLWSLHVRGNLKKK